MPLQARRPNLPAISLPSQLQTQSLLGEDVHTPIPFTPIPYSSIPFGQAPLVMTPDTPRFSIPPLDVAVAAIRSNEAIADSVDDTWTDDQDKLLQSYLMHPPRQLRASYPPGSLPPPNALDEITTQILAVSRSSSTAASSSTSTSWTHSWAATRARLFVFAREESMSAIGGHKRDKSESLSIIPMPAPSRPTLGVLGGATMSRQQHSMDSLYGDEESQGFSETLRLSNTLQNSAAKDSGSVLTSGDGLSSPLAFCFSFNQLGRKAGLPGFPFPASGFPRPASLLQRGKSFTSEDFPFDEETTAFTPQKIRPEMQRSASSPVSAMTTSPPSSISSQSISEENDGDLEFEADPITPLNQTFPHSLLGLRDNSSTTGSSDGSGNTTPAGTPAITFTVDSPPLINSRFMPATITPSSRSETSPTEYHSPSNAFAKLSLSTPFALNSNPNPPVISSTGGLRRSIRPVTLTRSLSDNPTGLIRALYNPVHEREAKRPRLKPVSGLSVSVPKPGVGQYNEELRSPFEIKSVNI